MSKLERILLFSNLFLYALITIFSYAYVDLNLTISQNQKILSFVNTMQSLGYYNRSLSTAIYITFISIAFVFFILNLYFAKKNEISLKFIKLSAILNTLILIFAYPFLSSDLFNYLFDAKIILHYHASPYSHRALDFPQDEWLRFMRWTHRLSPYGPVWLLLSLIPASMAFGKFILNFFFFKIFISTFHIVNIFLISKILRKINKKALLLGTALYALNPLFLIEGVANAHNDVVIATFILLSIDLFIRQKRSLLVTSILIGFFIKYLTIFLVPIFFFKKLKLETLIFLILVFITFFTFVYSTFGIKVPFISAGSTQIQFQPWYLFWTLPLVSLIPQTPYMILAESFALGAILRYLPYLYYGDWSHPSTILFMQSITLIFPLCAVTYLVYRKCLQR